MAQTASSHILGGASNRPHLAAIAKGGPNGPLEVRGPHLMNLIGNPARRSDSEMNWYENHHDRMMKWYDWMTEPVNESDLKLVAVFATSMNLQWILVTHILTFGLRMMWLGYCEMTACYLDKVFEVVRAHIIIRHDGIWWYLQAHS